MHATLSPSIPAPLAVLGVPGLTNLDYAATAPCLRVAADAVNELLPWYGSVHRGAGAFSQRCTVAYERARQSVATFLGCRADDHVVFTRNTTDALNLLAAALPPDTTVITSGGEHHANLLPWRRSVRLPVPDSPGAAVRAADAALRELRRGGNSAPILVAVTGASNVTGELWPIAQLAAIARRHGARIAVDAAQLAPHLPIDIGALGVDYVALSGHKLYAPFGVGVLAGRPDWLDAASPYLAGGGATVHVGDATHDVGYTVGPARHEAGTPNLLGAVALAAACDALGTADRVALAAHEQALLTRLRDGLGELPAVAELRMFAPDAARVGIVSFAVAGHDSAAVAAFLAREHGIGVRDGLFCAHPLARRLLLEAAARLGRPLPSTALRASIGLGTTIEDIDRIVTALGALALTAVNGHVRGNPPIGVRCGARRQVSQFPSDQVRETDHPSATSRLASGPLPLKSTPAGSTA
jgi:selenocysteine lyase/cysteine desulfurase